MSYNELKTHGKQDFPLELYVVNSQHPNYKMDFHWHTNLEIIRVTRGALLLTLDDHCYSLRAGDIVFINSETIHSAIPQYCDYECLVFNLAFLKNGNIECDEFIDDLLSHNSFLIEKPVDAELAAHCHRIFNEFNSTKPGHAFKMIGLMQFLLGLLQQKELFTHKPLSPIHDSKRIRALKATLSLIHENYADEIKLDDMADVAGLSKKYFSNFFKDMTQLTPVQYLMQYRIEQASKKLLTSNLSITQIAELCGFNNVSYFIKTFKVFRGTSPTEYRKK